MDIGSITTLGIFGLLGIMFLFGFLRGLRKGLWKSLMDLGFAILCLIISIIVAKGITNVFVDLEKMKEILVSLEGVLGSDTVNSLMEYIEQGIENPEIISAILAIPAALITPIVFILVHILLGIIIKIPKLIIERVVVGKNGGPNYRGGNRLLGGFVGGLRNALFMFILLIPIVGYVTFVGGTLDTVITATEGEAQLASSSDVDSDSSVAELKGIMDDFVNPIRNSPAIKVVDGMGGKLVFNSLTTKKVDSVKISVTKEVDGFAKLYANVLVIAEEEPASFGDKQKNSIENIKSILNEGEFIPLVASEVLSYVSTKWLNGEDAFGMEKIDVGEDYQDLFDGVLESFKETSSESIKEDFGTIANLMEICIDEGVFTELAKEEPDALKLATNAELLESIFAEAYKNVRIRPVIGYIPDLLVSIIGENFADEGDTTPKPDSVDVNTLTEAQIRADAAAIAGVIEKVLDFMESTENLDSSDENAFILHADLGSLGAAIDMLRNTALLGNSSEYILTVLLNSEMVSDLGFVSDDLIAKLTDKSTKFENILVSAQKLAVMAISLSKEGINEDNYEEALKFMITEMSPEAADTLKSVITTDALKDFGMSAEEADTMSNTINSVIDGISSATENMTEEQVEKEVEAISTIVGVMQDITSEGSNVDVDKIFGEEGDSVTGITADELVDTVLSSEIISNAVIGASKGENDEKVEDPYGIADSLSDDDKAVAEGAIKDYFENNSTGGTEDEALKEKLDAVANILGMDASAWFN